MGYGWYFRGNVFGWSTCEFFDNLFRYAQFKGFLCYGTYSGANLAKSVLGSTVRLVNSGNVECAWPLVKNASRRRAAEVFMETTEEHKVLRPTKNSRKSHSHGKRSIAWEKLVLPSLVAWRACTKIRDAPAEKRRESKAQRSSNEVFLSAVSRENFSSYWSTLHNLNRMMCF